MESKTIIIGTIALFTACQSGGNEKTMKNEFYTESHRDDLIRIPLLDPVELISADEGNEWLMKLPFGQIRDRNLDVSAIERIGVQDSVVVVYSRSMYYDSGMREVWIIIDMKAQKETALTDEESYHSWLFSHQLQNLRLYDVNAVFKQFDHEGVLPWHENVVPG